MEGQPTLAEIITVAGLRDEEVLNVYGFGSRVYGTALPTSDWDFAVVVDTYEGDTIKEVNNVGVSIFSWNEILQMSQKHHFQFLLLYYCPPEHRIRERRPLPFELNLMALRKAILRKCGSSMNRAHAYFVREHDYYRGKKMLSHSIRYFLYAEQIMASGRITDFSAGNQYYFEMLAMTSSDWLDYEQRFRPIYLAAMNQVFPLGSGHSHNQANLNEFLSLDQLQQGKAAKLTAAVLQDALDFPGAFTGVERKVIVEMIRSHDMGRTEFEEDFPDLLEMYEAVSADWARVLVQVDAEYQRAAAGQPSKRDFAAAIKGSRFTQLLLRLFTSGRTAADYLGSTEVRPAAALALLARVTEAPVL
jgi:hypothetical protein